MKASFLAIPLHWSSWGVAVASLAAVDGGTPAL